MTIHLSKPLITQESGNIRLSADIAYDSERFTLWFEVEEQFGQYLVDERSDSFVVAMFPWLMMKANKLKQEITLVCETCMSAKLWHQMTNYYIPTLSRCISYYGSVRIEADMASDALPLGKGVGSTVSGGLDSFYTILKYKDSPVEDFRLTHTMYCDLGLYGDGIGSENERQVSAKTRHISMEAGLEYVKVTSNIVKELYRAAHGPVVPAVITSNVLSLQKLFTVFHYSSANPVWELFMDEIQACSYDLLNMSCFSTENTTFYLSGMEVLRLDKAAYVADYQLAQENLLVCVSQVDAKNCSHCANCSHTMAEMDVLGKLDSFDKVFDVDSFRKNLGYHWGYVYMKSKEPPPGLYNGEIKEMVRLYRSKTGGIPLKVRWAALTKWVKRGFTTDNKSRRLAKDEIR